MERKLWHNKTVYQVYPRSFKDTTGNGIGDLNGITAKLDYLQELGIGIIWISPFYKSPMDDNGYDISDYYEVDPLFGTMADFDRLVEEALVRDIRIMVDLVVNHTSDEHPWFLESKSSLDNPKRDWYIWQSPKADGSAPTNWASHFSRSAWTLDETTGQYYLHLFSKKQPDLNWANPEVREAIYEMMHFWLKKGLAGFRMDTINMLGKPAVFRDASVEGRGPLGWEYWANNSRCHDYLQEMNEKVLSHYDIVNVGETAHVTPRDGKFYSHPGRKELNMIFQFEHMAIDGTRIGGVKDICLPDFKRIMAKWQDELNGSGWNSNYWGNHDQSRAVSRFGHEGQYRIQSAQMLAATLHMMFGTPYVYQGEEVGLTDTNYDTIEDYNDLLDHHLFNVLTEDKGMAPASALKQLQHFSRDNARVPMRWDATDNAGFTSGKPWLKMPNNYKTLNVAKDYEDHKGTYNFYKALIGLRRDSVYSDTITYGKHRLLEVEHPQLWAYERFDEGNRLLILSNFTEEICQVSMALKAQKILLTNYDREDVDLSSYTMSPYETLVLELA